MASTKTVIRKGDKFYTPYTETDERTGNQKGKFGVRSKANVFNSKKAAQDIIKLHGLTGAAAEPADASLDLLPQKERDRLTKAAAGETSKSGKAPSKAQAPASGPAAPKGKSVADQNKAAKGEAEGGKAPKAAAPKAASPRKTGTKPGGSEPVNTGPATGEGAADAVTAKEGFVPNPGQSAEAEGV